MRPDLLEAQASVDWAVSCFPSLQERLDAWRNKNVHVRIEELPADNPNNLIVAEPQEPLPFVFNAEAGAYINAIRSALDILATSVAQRHGMTGKALDSVYFPIASSESAFKAGKYKGKEFIDGIPTTERTIIESLKPYKGGNELLWSLHDLDIRRKHKRLLTVEANFAKFSITGWGLSDNFTPISTGFVHNPDQTILGFLKKGTDSRYQMEFSSYVGINEAGPLARKPVLVALNRLAELASSIISRFDI